MLHALLRTTAGALSAASWIFVLAACDSTVVGGGGGSAPDGAGGATAAVGTGDPVTTGAPSAAETSSADTGASTGTGDVPSTVQGVLVPGAEGRVAFLLANAPQSCAAPLTEPPCASGSRWLAHIGIAVEDLAVGTYELGGARMGIDVTETFDFCAGFGGRGWDGEPAWLTIESIDAVHAVVTIEGAYDDVDGTWDVPLCAGVTPAP